MPTLGEQDLLIPYGTGRWSADNIAIVETGPGTSEVECRVPHVVIRRDRGLPLRLGDAEGEHRAGPARKDPFSSPDPLTHAFERLRVHCDLWRKHQGIFLDRYQAFIVAHLEAHRTELETGLARFGDLFGYKDWAFSALRPLPRAHLWAPAARGTPLYGPEGMVASDFAFWTGDRIVAVMLSGSSPSADTAAETRLNETGIDVVRIPHAALAEPADQGPAPLLPPAFHRFWEGEPLPTGPLKPEIPETPEGD